jgi:Holliday junction DNA helicase RuvA
MIAKLTGVLDSCGEDWAIIDVGGVGYLVYCSGRTLGRLPGVGGQASLSIETHVREDHIHLYGFADTLERDWFRLLTTVQGIGAKVALGLLTVMSPDEIAAAIVAQDRAALTRAAGVGAKLAARVLVELKDRAAEVAVVRRVDFGAVGDDGAMVDAVSALVNLGYRRVEAFGAVSEAARSLGGDAPVETLVKAGLKELSA